MLRSVYPLKRLAVYFFFFKQKTAYEISACLVGSEMCIRDREKAVAAYNTANSLLDKAVTSHLKHKNYTARQKARLAKAVNSL